MSGSWRGQRGGRWYDVDTNLASSCHFDNDLLGEGLGVGFRVASSFTAVPEPSSMLMGLALLTSGLLGRHRGKTSL